VQVIVSAVLSAFSRPAKMDAKRRGHSRPSRHYHCVRVRIPAPPG